jgi:hypothetical protein
MRSRPLSRRLKVMPTPEQLARVKLLVTSPDELAYFFDQLTSPDWLPLLRDGGLLGDPPAPIEQGDGVMFPFWPASRYMVRIAADAPRAVADTLWAARQSRNPRVWWDTVDALVKMPPEHAIRFIPLIEGWVHHPWRLGLETSTARLVHHLIADGARIPAIDLARDLARLVRPEGWPEADPWVVLDDYDYGKEIPAISRDLAAFGPAGPAAFVEELEAFLAVERPEREDGRRDDLSFIWRPAIEDHEQNWDFEREAKLVIAIRDGFEEVLARSPEELEGVVTVLLGSVWPVVRRVGLHLLVARGDQAPALVEQVLTNRDMLAEGHHRHEFYRLLSTRFGLLSRDAKGKFVANVHSVADATVASVAGHWAEADPEIVRKVVVRRWLSPISEHLEVADRADLEGARAGTGEDPHPDFPSYHTSWMGSTSPLSSDELRNRTPDEIVGYLATWEEPAGFGPDHPSAAGLAQQLAEAVAEAPDDFVPSAERYLDLKPAYFDGFINGLQKALQNDRPFEWEPVLAACEVAIGKVDEGPTEDRETTWKGTRMTVVRLLEHGLEGKTDEIPMASRDRVWALISGLVEDPDPTPADEARYGPPNMDPETYSLNTTRGVAFHALFLYLLWHHRQSGGPENWSVVEQDPEASAVLDAHLDPGRDPSVAVRAAYGWWLPYVLNLDPRWVRDRAARIVGRAETDLERAAWEGFLFRSGPSRVALDVFAGTYAAYAEHLASLDAKPDARARPGDPIQFLIDHLVKAWLWLADVRETLPLRTLLASGKAWLAAEVVEEAGRLIGRTEAKDVSPELAAAYRDLWTLVLEATANLEGDGLKNALAPFAWWFDSELSGEWTLPELLRLLERGIKPDPDFSIFRRLPSFAADHPKETLRVVELLADEGGERWTVQVHEGEIRQVLEVSIHSADGLIRARAEAVVHRLGRMGLGGLASLLKAPGGT